jgi:hypothetical protein
MKKKQRLMHEFRSMQKQSPEAFPLLREALRSPALFAPKKQRSESSGPMRRTE